MTIIHCRGREPEILSKLLRTWESSVRATHGFLTAGDIDRLRPMVEGYLASVPVLAYVRDEDAGFPGFIGLDGTKIEMLFVRSSSRGRGIGRALLEWAVAEHQASRLDVNEQNPQAVGFYQHMGFRINGRSEKDGQGNPFPLLHMRRD